MSVAPVVLGSHLLWKGIALVVLGSHRLWKLLVDTACPRITSSVIHLQEVAVVVGLVTCCDILLFVVYYCYRFCCFGNYERLLAGMK